LAAARELGLSSAANIYDAIRRVKALASSKGYSPEHGLSHVIPAPFVARGLRFAVPPR
jgi:hypothetical protein